MLAYKIYLIVDVIVVFVLFFFSVFLLVSKRGNRMAKGLLSAFLLALALSYMDGVFINLKIFIHPNFHHIVHACMSADFLIGPLLWLYVQARTRENFQLKAQQLLHFLPAALHLGFLLFSFSIAAQRQQFGPYGGIQAFSHTDVLLLTTLSTGFLLFYFVLIFVSLRRYQHSVKQRYSTLHGQNTRWLYLLLAGFACTALLRFANNYLWLQMPDAAVLRYLDLKLFAVVGVFVFANVLLFFTLNRPEVLLAIAEKPEIDSHPKSNLLDESTRREYTKLIQQHMQEKKPHLDSNLSLSQLAQALGISVHHLSYVLNADLKQNFFDFVNRYRIEEAIRLLSKDSATITQVMYDAGFNSKSVFNTSFKARTGMTPSAYRKQAAELPACD